MKRNDSFRRRRPLLATTTVIALLTLLPAVSAASQVKYTINQSIVCNNVASFCPGIKVVNTVSATGFWDGSYISTVVTSIYQGNTLVTTITESAQGPFRIGTDENFVTSGTNTTTVFCSDRISPGLEARSLACDDAFQCNTMQFSSSLDSCLREGICFTRLKRPAPEFSSDSIRPL
jgi:hypothetical protein